MEKVPKLAPLSSGVGVRLAIAERDSPWGTMVLRLEL